MDKREAIVQAAESRVGCGYIYGATGWVCTQARLDAQAKQYPAYAEKIYYYGRKYWLNKICYDCAQLTRRAARDAGYTFVSGANSQWNMGLWAQKGTIDTLPQEKAIFLFIRDEKTGRMKHVAIAVGGGFEVEARGHAYGVVKRKIADCAFTHWARLSDIDGEVKDPLPPALRLGARGEAVKRLQTLLLTAGCLLPRYGADGIFGTETQAAVISFQAARELKPDGIAGEETWAALLTAKPEEGESGEEEAVSYRVVIGDLTIAKAQEIAARYPGASIMTEGGESV